MSRPKPPDLHVLLLRDLYGDPAACARHIGLTYCTDDQPGISRHKHGRGWRYEDASGKTITASNVKKRLHDLAVPPAWRQVWLCADAQSHILATGLDEKGRKQYMYHPTWRTARDLLKFYRLLLFGNALPAIRSTIQSNLSHQNIDFKSVMAAMLWILDNTYVRIGNEAYFEQNESIGLTTMLSESAMVNGSVVTFNFTAKSGQKRTIAVDNSSIAAIVRHLQAIGAERLFVFETETGFRPITANEINDYLKNLTGEHLTAKDFRTWGGTLLAFDYLTQNRHSQRKPEKVLIAAVDTAAGILGNTRSVARSSYVHPHLLKIYGSKHFEQFYQLAQRHHTKAGLGRRETELLYFLDKLFEVEIEALQQGTTSQQPGRAENALLQPLINQRLAIT